MDIQVRKYRSMLKAVGKEISDADERVDADTLLEIAQSLQPSKLGTACSGLTVWKNGITTVRAKTKMVLSGCVQKLSLPRS